MDWWKKLTPAHLRWGAAAVGAVFVFALLLSDFLRLLDLQGAAYALDRAELELGLTNPVEGIRRLDDPARYIIDVPLKALAIMAIAGAGALLFVASQRSKNSN